MDINSIVTISQQQLQSRISAVMQVDVAKRGLDQQKLEGEEALKLMEAAALPIDPHLGQTLDIYA